MNLPRKFVPPTLFYAIVILFAGANELVKTTRAQESNTVSTPQSLSAPAPVGALEMLSPPPGAPVMAVAKIDRQELMRQTDDLLRMRRAEILKELGCEVDWARYTNAELLDMELRIRKGKELERLGSTMNWSTATYEEMCDKERCLLKIAWLEKSGLLLYWTKYNYAQLCDLEARVKKAQRLRKLGKDVAWQDYTLDRLNQLEASVWSAHPGGL